MERQRPPVRVSRFFAGPEERKSMNTSLPLLALSVAIASLAGQASAQTPPGISAPTTAAAFRVEGAPGRRVAAPDDVLWLKLEETSRRDGALSGLTTMPRIDTKGGTAQVSSDKAMRHVHAFWLGAIAAWTPGVVLLAWFLLRARESERPKKSPRP